MASFLLLFNYFDLGAVLELVRPQHDLVAGFGPADDFNHIAERFPGADSSLPHAIILDQKQGLLFPL